MLRWPTQSRRRLGEEEGDDEALLDLNEAIRLDPRNARAFLERGYVWQQKEQLDKAIADDDEAIRIDPHLPGAHASRGWAWWCKGHADKAFADDSEEIRLNPRVAKAYANRGAIGSQGRGRESLRRPRSGDPTRSPRLHGLHRPGAAWMRRGEPDKAIADLNEAIRLDRDNARAFSNRGFLGDEGRIRQSSCRSGRGDSTRSPGAASYANRAKTWALKKEYDKAIADYDEAIRLSPRSASFFLHRGKAWQAKGRSDKASADFEEASRLEPQDTGRFVYRRMGGGAVVPEGKAFAELAEANGLPLEDGGVLSGNGLVLFAQDHVQPLNAQRTVTSATRPASGPGGRMPGRSTPGGGVCRGGGPRQGREGAATWRRRPGSAS